MTKLLPIFLLSLISLNLSASKKVLAVEGRTWWYRGEQGYIQNGKQQEFGVRIGEEVTLNGEKWNRVFICKYTDPHAPGTVSEVKSDTTTIALIKDDGLKVEVRGVDPIHITNWLDALKGYLPFLTEGEYLPYTLYLYGQVGDTATYGCSQDPTFYVIDSIDSVENSGNTFGRYKVTFKPESDSWASYLNSKNYNYLDWIGNPTTFFLYPIGGGFASIASYTYPRLTYVTDGDDNRVIYEAEGGPKLWEQAGVGCVVADDENAPVEYFNLQGVRIDQPAAGSLVIRRQGAKATKVLVK